MAGSFWDKYTTHRLSRRRMLKTTGVAGAAAGAIAIVGCGGGDDDETPTPGAGGESPVAGETPTPEVLKPVRGGRYKVASTADFDTFDPYLSIAAGVGYFPRLYNVLVNFSALDSSFRFDDLSTSFENPDGNTYIFSIRPGVKVGPNSLGVPERDLNAQDVVASYDRVVNLPQSNAYAFLGQWMEKQEASADGMTYTFTAKGPYAYFRNRIGSAINTIVPAEALAEGTVDQLKTQAAGAGAYVLANYAEGQGATLNANPNYYRTDENNNNEKLPYVDGIDVSIITERAALRTAFVDKQLSTYGAQNVRDAKDLNSDGKYVERRDPVNTFIAFTMNPDKEPWQEDRIRKAAMHAINRQDFIERVYDGEAQANGLCHWPLGDVGLPSDERDELQKYDPQMSKDLIRAVTGEDTIKIKMMYPAESEIEEHNLHLPIFLQQMQQAGFEIEEDPQAFGTWLDNYTNRNYDCTLALNQVYEYAEFNMDFQHSGGPSRNGIYAKGVGALYPEIDAKIDEVKGITDPEEFQAAMWDLQRLIYEKGPTFLPLVSPYAFTLYQKNVKGIPEGIGASGLHVNTFYIDPAVQI